MNFPEYVAVTGEELVGFGPPLCRPRLRSEGPDVQGVPGTGPDDLFIEFPGQTGLADYRTKCLMGTRQGAEGALDAEFMNPSAGLAGRFLHRQAKEVVGDYHHAEGLVRHRGRLDREALHSHRGLEVTELHFDLPALHVEIAHILGRIGVRVQQVGDNDQGGLFPGPVLVSQLDVAQGHLSRKPLPLRLIQVASGRGIARPLPGNETFDGADFPAFAPIELSVAGLVKTHDDVALTLRDDSGNELERAEGAVAQNDLSGIAVFEKAGGYARVVLPEAACLETLHSAVTEVDHADDAHDGKPAADLLAGVLWIGCLIGRRVHERDGGAVDSLQEVAAPESGRLDPAGQSPTDPLVNGHEEVVRDPATGPAERAGIAARHSEPEHAVPRLDQAQRFVATGVALEDLGEPRPKYRDVAEAALPFGGVDAGKEATGKDVLENQGVSANGVFLELLSERAHRGLRPAFGGGKHSARKIGQERLSGHAF